jgi:phosphatidylinositol alpha-1,6-mannosyltransferase
LLFVGGGPALDAAKELAAQSPVASSIEVAGFVAESAMESIWRRASVFAMPSSEEGFGLVFIEAMRRGIPVIASTEDAGQEINGDGSTGFNLTLARRREIADAIVHLLRDPDLSLRLGAAGHARWRQEFRFSSFDARLQAAMAGFLAV